MTSVTSLYTHAVMSFALPCFGRPLLTDDRRASAIPLYLRFRSNFIDDFSFSSFKLTHKLSHTLATLQFRAAPCRRDLWWWHMGISYQVAPAVEVTFSCAGYR